MPGPAPRGYDVGAIAFDLDGTLLDTLHDLAAALNALLAERGYPRLDKEAVRPLVGRGIESLVTRGLALARNAPAGAAEVAAALAVFEQHYDAVLGRETGLYPGVAEGLERMRAMGIPLAVVTNKAARFVGPHLERAGIAGAFALVIAGDTLPEKKPSAGPLLHAAATFRIAPARLLMVGDSGNDVGAARAAGCPVLVLPYGYSEGTPVQNLGADGIVPSLAAVADIVRYVPAG